MLPKFKNYAGQEIRIVERKEDGHSITVKVGSTGVMVTTKNYKDITHKLKMIDHLWQGLCGLPQTTILLAELHAPGIHATSVPTLINEADHRLQMTVFALPLIDGCSMWRESFSHVHKTILGFGLTPPSVRMAWENPASLSDDLQAQLLEEASLQKIEGWVCKLNHMDGWYKLKPTKTVDAFVIGVQTSYEATSYGGLKSITVAVWDGRHVVEIATVGSGFEGEYRMSVDKPSLLYKVAEIEYDCVAADGRLRFPRFLRWRDDKDWKSCTKDQLQ